MVDDDDATDDDESVPTGFGDANEDPLFQATFETSHSGRQTRPRVIRLFSDRVCLYRSATDARAEQTISGVVVDERQEQLLAPSEPLQPPEPSLPAAAAAASIPQPAQPSAPHPAQPAGTEQEPPPEQLAALSQSSSTDVTQARVKALEEVCSFTSVAGGGLLVRSSRNHPVTAL